ncbi:RNA polymerase sigma-70 factor [uncultured Bacteroides sp.]|uniref:RNA polymerase sigma-70 factor n=1 Tax=uncultured Bacteroides sp. TaxID=162156 RepID=UPI00280BD8C7|nr:RNA polymerase sigma-70 factor [uncultured Bacteroides sp.]
MSDTQSKDTSLLTAMQNGDRSAFDMLFQKYYSVLCAYCYRFVRLEDAEEIVQDVMLWLWENRERPIIEYSLKQYLFKAVYHRCMTRIVQNEVKQRADTAYHERMSAMLQDVDIYQINELSRHIQKAINELPPAYKEAFIMHRFRNLSYKEAAELLNVSPKTVDYRIQQALKILRVKLKDYLPLILMQLLTSH